MTKSIQLTSAIIALLITTAAGACATEAPNYATYGFAVAAYDAQGALVDSTCWKFLTDSVDSELWLLAPSITVPDEKSLLPSVAFKQAGGDSDYAIRVLDSKDAEVRALSYTAAQSKAGTTVIESVTLKEKAYRFVFKGVPESTDMKCPTFEATLAP